MADVQGIYDELVEMGYAALPSPPVTAETEEAQIETFPEPVAMPPTATQEAQTTAPAGVSTNDMGGLGNITLPKNSSKNKEDFLKISQNLISKASSLEQRLRQLLEKENNSLQLDTGAKMTTQNKTEKTAAGPDNLEVITEKQLMKQEESLHPRTEEVYEGITESKEQIGGKERSNDTTSESPQVRKGTYDTITEDQLKTESALGDAVIHFVDYPDVITEKQWNDFSRDVAGDLPDDYTEQITQAQIRELLSKHKFLGDRETITEDQLRDISMTDGLKRWANKAYTTSLVKTATNVVVDTITKFRKSPTEIAKVATSINDDSKLKDKVAFLAVVNSIPQRKDSRDDVVANASYFSKQASANNLSTMDALILSASNHGQFNMKAEDLFDSVYHIVNSKTAMKKVDDLVKTASEEKEVKTVSKAAALDSALKALDKPEDGKYRIQATVADVGVPITEKEAFVAGVKKLAQEMIDDPEVTAAVIRVEVTPEGDLIIDVQDGAENEICADDLGDAIENEVEDIDADINGDEGLEEEKEMDMGGDMKPAEPAPAQPQMPLASDKKEVKEAQMMGGEMGGQGGASQAPGAGASMPAAPPMQAPPMETLTEEPGMEEEGGLDESLEPTPPGTHCVVCGSDDVDIMDGKGQCNNCGSEMSFKVQIEVPNWAGVTPDKGAEEGGEFEGEGFELPEGDEFGADMGEELPAMAASTRLKPKALTKLAESKIELGSVSPATGTTNTAKLAEGQYVCLDTGTKYKVSFVVDNKNGAAHGQWEWKPATAHSICPSCSRAKHRFIKALASVKMTPEQFDKMDLEEKVATIVKLKKAGKLQPIKTADKERSVAEDMKLAYGGWGDKFPLESCIEKLSRRFGEDAVCLSGPDEGKPLAASICNRLKKADVYSDRLAIKVADNWIDCDGDEDCIAYQVRAGHSLRTAASICEQLKITMAQAEDFFADELANDEVGPVEEAPVEDAGLEEEVDPFDEGGDITITLPQDIALQLDEQLDVALGEDPAMEEHHEEAPIADGLGEEPPVEEVTPEELAETKEMMPAGGEMSAAEPGGDMKPATPGVAEFEEDVQKNRGNLGGGSKVEVTVNGQPLSNPVAEGEEEIKEAEETEGYDIKEAMNMHGSLGKVGKAQMDLSGVVAVLKKQAGEKEVSQEKAQDSKDIGSYTAGENGSLMGHENETIPSAGKPSVPRDNATMGQEPPELNPQDKPQPSIPAGDATMGHEKEVGLGDVVPESRYTGGDKGQGKTELASTDDDLYHMKGFGSSKKGLSDLADRVAKKLAPKAPVADDKDIQPISGESTIGKEEAFTADTPTNTEGSATESLMGEEKSTLDKAPKSPADHPEVFTGNAQMGKEDLDSEKTVKDKGTVIASDSESEACRVAGRMLQAKMIEASELSGKISELKAYKPEQIADFEKAIFAKKGLDTGSDGKLSQTVQINEASSVKNAHDELSKQLQAMFTLGKQNTIADEDTTTQLRRAYRK